MDKINIEILYNEIFGKPFIYYRDLHLAQNLITSYKTNQIIMERGFTDMTSFSEGLSTNCRYTIITSSAKNISMFNPILEELGHVVLAAGTFFKVLDVYTLDNKTQIILLQIPKHGIPFLKVNNFNSEKKIVSQLRSQFTQKITQPILKITQTKEWLERVSNPIGMNQEGVLFFCQ